MANKVISSSIIKTIINGGRSITFKYKVETDSRKRYTLALGVQDKFVKAIEKADVPSGAMTAITT